MRAEAEAVRAAVAALRDDAVAAALGASAELLIEQRGDVLAANADDVAAADGVLDRGALDRLRLDEDRLHDVAAGLRIVAALPPLEREIERRRLENGLEVSVRRIPVGVIGANFEARPAVAVDIASQLLKSLNGCVLRTGGAALRTVTVLVDDVLRRGLARAGLPPALVGLVRSPDRAGAAALVSLPRELPLVILRGSGSGTAALARVAAEHGVQTLAHAEGGGVLYVDEHADSARAETLVETSLDRLGVCNRLNLLLVHRAIDPAPLVRRARAAGVEVYGTERARAVCDLRPLDVPLGHEWASDPERVASITVEVVASVDDAVAIANEQTSGLAAGIVTENAAVATAFLDGYRGTAAFWHAPTRFTDGAELTTAPETGINVGWAPGPRGPVTYRDLWLRQYRVIGDGTQRR